MLGEEVDGGAGGSCILGGVIGCQLLDSHHPGAAILGPANLLLDKDRGFGDGLLDGLFLSELVDGLLVVGGTPTKPVHTTLKGVVTGLPHVLVLGHYF